MYQIVLFIHVIVCIVLVGLVLLQHGKGADIGASFGSGASNTVFGSQGSGSFLMKLTAILAAAFFAGCLILGGMATYSYKNVKILSSDVAQSIPKPVTETTPATNTASEKKSD